jgi:flagellar biosynthesis component FlhA
VVLNGRQEHFSKGAFVKKDSVGNRFGVVAFVYVLLLPLPAVLLSFLLFGSFSQAKTFVLFSLLVVTAYSLTTLYSRSTVN